MALRLQPEEEVEEEGQGQGRVGSNHGGGGGGDEGGSKAPRLPRWTRQEILVLIQGKTMAENRVRRGRSAALAMAYAGGSGSTPAVEPKWATVSSYCKRHGVNRGPVQCRKRWSNLAGDFKKIKEWESKIKDDSDSFWVMRNDLRRERKLPGFFDKEVYDILDGSPPPQIQSESPPPPNTLPSSGARTQPVFDSGRSAAADDGLFSDFEQETPTRSRDRDMDMDMDTDTDTPVAATMPAPVPVPVPVPVPQPHKDAPSPTPLPIPAPTPMSEQQYQPFTAGATDPGTSEKQPALNPEMGSTSHQGRKRRRFLSEYDVLEEPTIHDQLVDVLERNGRILSAQLDAHNINLKMDREERKDHAASLVAVLNKLADALGRIADKL